ncbi:MAG: hypothetical protein CBC35_00930 [Planctomycetes bacterium TMED75]|nr:hypothetical protein [Planctomycetaceae bacterium]OUU96522.1 MAG: hypothetical protein CBC35_00930 [Planctomycetes bacterium TMED75]
MPATEPADVGQVLKGQGTMRLLSGGGSVLLGGLLLTLVLIPSSSWTAFFLHPLRAPGGAPLPVLGEGVGLLRVLLPLCGIGWLMAGWYLLRRTPTHAGLRADPTTSVNRFLIFGICVAIVGGILIRLPLLEDGLWYDEIAAFWYYGQFGPGPIMGNMFTPANHVAQTLATWGAVSLNGGALDPITLRLPALVMGLASCWPIWILVRETIGGRWPLVGLLLLMLCPIAVLESTEARGYAFMLFFSASACALMTRYLRTGRLELLPVYALCCACGIWSHLVTVVVPVGHACLLVAMFCWSTQSNRRAAFALLSIALAALMTATLLAPTLPELWQGSSAFRALDADQPVLIGREGRWAVLGLGGSWAYFGGLCGLVLAAIGLTGAKGNSAIGRGLLVCGLPLLVALALILLLGTWIYARFLLLGLPFTLLAVTTGLHRVRLRSPLAAGCLAVLLVAGWTTDLWYRYQTPRQPIREIMAQIPDDDSRIAVIGVVDFPIILSWYVENPQRIVDAGRLLGENQELLKSSSIEWLVVGYPEKTVSDSQTRSALQIGKERLPNGFEVVDFQPGWIDEDGSMALLRRVRAPVPGQS